MIGKAVAFTVRLTTNGSEIDGTFTDEETLDIFPDGGILVGVTENNYISLTKQYPCYWEIDEEGNKYYELETPSHFIMYEGYFNNDKFEGNWEVPMYEMDVEIESIYHYEHIGGSSTWWMKRKD